MGVDKWVKFLVSVRELWSDEWCTGIDVVRYRVTANEKNSRVGWYIPAAAAPFTRIRWVASNLGGQV